MTNLQHIQANIAWAKKWLATPEADLPGTLTHDKCGEVLESAQDELLEYSLDHARYAVTQDGLAFSHYAE